jgi:hypothetical protein
MANPDASVNSVSTRWRARGVVLGAIAITLFAPDLVSGSEHEDLPLPAILVWLWADIAAPVSAAFATTYACLWAALRR